MSDPAPTAAPLHDTAQVILDAARRVFVEHGFAGTSMTTVAEAAGINKSLIYHHFGDKQQLWQAVKRAAFAEYAQAQMTMLAEQAPTAALLRASGEAYFRFLQHRPDVVRLLCWMYLEGDTTCTELEEAVLAGGVQKLRDAQAAGELRPDLDPHFMLAAYIGTLQRWFMSRQDFLHGSPFMNDWKAADEQFLHVCMSTFFEGILPAGRPSPVAKPGSQA